MAVRYGPLNKRAINHRHTLGKLLRYWPFIIALIVTSLASLPPAETALAQFSDVGYRDHRMGSNCVSAPTGEKPESKLWWHDGTWWGNLCHSDGNFHIYRLNMATQTWEDTGVAVDNRKSDALMDPATNKLYIVTHVFSTSATPQTCPSQCGRLYRFSYNASSRIFTLDSGFPVTVTGGRAEAVVLAKDSTGQLWVTYVENRRVMVNRSLGSDTNWGTPFQLPSSSAAGNVSSDDISSIVAFQGKIGVMWSNQNTDKFYFAIHNDNDDDMTWQTEEVAAQGNGIADDHISLQADSSGRVFAAVKTSTDPLNLMLVRQPNGQWSTHVFGTDADSHTRPILVVDSVNGRVHYFATSGQSGGAIYYKSTSTTNPSFPPGKGEIFISHSSSTRINNPTSMKSNVSPTTGLVVAASDSNYYYHNFLSLGGSQPPTVTATATTTTPTATPTTTTPTATATTTGTPGPVMTFSPTDDSWVRSTSPSSNYGSQDTVRVRLTASETINTYLKFNLSGITGPVQGAKLRLFVADDSPSGGSIYLVSNNLAGSSTPWTESTIRWNNAPPVSGTPLDTAGTATTGTWVEFDVSAAITGNGIYSFAIANGSTNSVLYNSKEAASNRPELVIQVGGGGSTPTATTTATATATQTPTATTTATGTPSDPGGGTQLTFGATDDTQVKSSKPTSNYGSLTSLRVRFTSSEIINSYLKFNVTGTGGSVSSAILRLYVTDDSPDGGSIYLVSNNLAGSTTPWTESNINWNNAPPFSGSPLDSAGPVAAGVWVEFDVTAAITGDGVYSFALTSNSSNSALFEASEAASNQPQLVVTIGNGPSSGAAAQSAINTATPTDTDTPTATITPEPPPASPTSSAQIAFSPSDDAQVKSDSPDRNYGSLPSLRARTASSDIIGSYLKFNITGLTGAPSQAILRLYVADASPDSGSIYLVSNDLRDGSAPWTEGTITWNNAPAYGGTPVASSVEAIEGSWVYFDVTEAITGNGIYSFALFSNHSNSVLYNSKEAGENGPLLIIETGESVQTGALQTFSLPATEAVELENPAPQMMLALQDQPEEHLDALDDGQIIESDSGLVVLSPGWVPVSAPGASGSTFVVNTSPDDSLTFNFSGTRIEIGYVAGEAFAPFVIQVDGQQIQTVAGGGQPEFQFHQRAVVDGLSEGLHTLQILPQNGVVAIDYFVTFVPPAPIVVAQANQEPQMVETIEAEPPPVETIDQMLPTSDPIVVLEPPVIVEMPTATPTPVAIPLPVYAGGPDSFDIAGAWRLSDDGQRWHVDGFDTSVLSLRFPLDLRGAQYPAVQFQSWLNANNASAGLQMSLDGQTWNMLTIMLPANDWQPLTIDLSLFKGQVIWLRWVWLPQPPVENDPIADFWELQSIMVIDLPPATPTDTPTGIPTEIPTLELPVVPTFPVIVTEEVTAPPEPQLPTEVLPTPAPVEPEPTLEEIQPEQPESGGDQEPETLPEQAPQNTIDNAPGNAEATEAVPAG